MSKDSIEERNDAVIMTMQSQKCLFHGKVVKDCKSVFFLSKKYASFCYNNVFHIFCLKNFDLENYFWKQRAIGRRWDNLIVRDFGYNYNTTELQFSVRPIVGNVQGPVGKFNRISDEPSTKRKRTALPYKFKLQTKFAYVHYQKIWIIATSESVNRIVSADIMIYKKEKLATT